MTTISDVMEKFYADHEVKPYISPERDLEAWLLDPKPVSKRNMELLQDGLLAGDIILLWRIHFGTFTTETWFPKYFEYTYGIHASEHLKALVEKGYTFIESAFDSLEMCIRDRFQVVSEEDRWDQRAEAAYNDSLS